jgi:hypothetical protein
MNTLATTLSWVEQGIVPDSLIHAGIRRLGCSEECIRMWEFYLSYCEGGFAKRVLADVQMLVNPGARPESIVPALEQSQEAP